MSEDSRVAFIRQRLTEALDPLRLEIVDESHKHAGHRGNVQGGGHYQVNVVSEAFVGKRLLERHQMVYAALGDAMKAEIHALGINARTPEEVEGG